MGPLLSAPSLSVNAYKHWSSFREENVVVSYMVRVGKFRKQTAMRRGMSVAAYLDWASPEVVPILCTERPTFLVTTCKPLGGHLESECNGWKVLN
jgi:hypothetical protein